MIYGVFRAKYTFKINAVATAGGRIAGSGAYVEGEDVQLVAVSEKGYRFIGWYDGENLVSDDTVYAFTAEKDGEYLARFEEYSKWEGPLETPETSDDLGNNDLSSEIENSDTTSEQESTSSDSSKENNESQSGCKSSVSALSALWGALACLFIVFKKKRV